MNILEFKKKTKETIKIDRSSNNSLIPSGVQAIGIDLGTTNSVVSIFVDGAKNPTTLEYEGSKLIPSIIYFDSNNEETLVGTKALKFLNHQSADVIKSTKRNMGKKSSQFNSNGKSFSAEEVAALILNYIASHPTLVAEKEKFGSLWAVVTVPAHFDDAARTATILAAEKAGIQVLRIINEPTAAALAYSMIDENDKHSNENLAVFDFGGGTFDVSIVEKNELTFNVLSSEGDVNLGGDDIDEVVAEFLLKNVAPLFVARRAEKGSELYRKVALLAQNAKKQLQTEASVQIQNQDLDGKGSNINVTLERLNFEDMIVPILEKTIYLTESSIQSAKKSPKNISRILLVGGSTRLNLIRRMLADYFPCIVDARLEPDITVSWGASLQAAMILGIQLDTILVDVCTHSLGIGVVESSQTAQDNLKIIGREYGLIYPFSQTELQNKLGSKIDEFHLKVQSLLRVAPILYRNSPLPARKSEFFNTVYHNQQAVHVVVVQGEGEIVADNRLIGSFFFELEQPCPQGSRCEIQLTYDVNGMVQVFAKQLGTHNELKAHFDSRTGEVQGWSKVNQTPCVPSITETKTTEPLEKVDLSFQQSKVIPLSFGTSKAKKTENLVNTKENNLSEITSVNAIILRAKRVLSNHDLSPEEYNRIFELTKTYSTLLSLSNNESQIDNIEEKLLSHLEGK